MIHPLVFTAYFTEHCNSLTSSSNIQTCTNTTDRVPLPAFVIFLKFLLMSVCKMKILINLYTKVPGVLMVYSRCIPFVQFGKLKMWDGILFQLSLFLTFRVTVSDNVGVNFCIHKNPASDRKAMIIQGDYLSNASKVLLLLVTKYNGYHIIKKFNFYMLPDFPA